MINKTYLGKVFQLKMIYLIRFFFIILLCFNNITFADDNQIIFKVNENIISTIDLKNRIKYLEVLNSNIFNPEMKIELPLLDIFGRGGSLKSSWYGDCLPTRDFPLYVDLHLQGRLPLDKFVSETISLSEVEESFAKMERGEVLRSVVVI